MMHDDNFYFHALKCIDVSETLYLRIFHMIFSLFMIYEIAIVCFYWCYAATGSASNLLNHLSSALKPIFHLLIQFLTPASSVTCVQLPSHIQPF